MTNTADDRGSIDIATDEAFAQLDGAHTRNCCWHLVMSYAENWTASQVEDPTAEWCKGEPTVDLMVNFALDSCDGMCNC